MKQSMYFQKPEILAPAGAMPQLIAAVENGADAVYLGSPSFNARMQAGNFDEQTFAEAIRYAHVRGVKTNIAFITNILQNPTFQAGKCHTKFIDEATELEEE